MRLGSLFTIPLQILYTLSTICPVQRGKIKEQKPITAQKQPKRRTQK